MMVTIEDGTQALGEVAALFQEYKAFDTLARLAACNHIYQKRGFQRIPAYYGNPLPGVYYDRLDFPKAAKEAV